MSDIIPSGVIPPIVTNNPIELEITPLPMARSQITSGQVNGLISLIAASDPPIINFPSGKSYEDVKSFTLRINPNHAGVVNILFNS
jgi:hypothetical protein